MPTLLSLDYETYSPVDLKKHGLDRYSREAEVLMCAYRITGQPPRLWEPHREPRVPADLRDALTDPAVRKWAFNAQFERVITTRVLGIATPLTSWRCTMALAYMHSFSGGLDQIGAQIGVSLAHMKDAAGKRLIKLFTQPQKVTRNQPHERRSWITDPEEWERFGAYCLQDEKAETAIRRKLKPYPVPDFEWDVYALDQEINDRGMPVDLALVKNALRMAELRKNELLAELRDRTGLANPNSTLQLMPWLVERGYPYADLRADTVKKALKKSEDLSDEAVAALRLRQWAARTSVKKYAAILNAVGPDGRMRYLFQYGGASRTLRFAGRRVQTQNLPRTPKLIDPEDDDALLQAATDIVRNGDYDALRMFAPEPMEILVGIIRSAFRAKHRKRFVTADFSSIESAVIAWLARCLRLLHVFRNKLDPYKDFGTEFYRKPYDEITKAERNVCKPPALGCGFGMGGGDIEDGVKSGLWAYAENMGIDITKEEAHRAVQVYRSTYPEIPRFWRDIEDALIRTTERGRDSVVGALRFEKRGDYLAMILPSGRPIYYYKPKIIVRTYKSKKTFQRVKVDGKVVKVAETYTRRVFTYEGQHQKTGKWTRLDGTGPKICENAVQATARELLVRALMRLKREGFTLVGHVHDEAIAEEREGDNVFNLENMLRIMQRGFPWAEGLPIGAAGWQGVFYRK